MKLQIPAGTFHAYLFDCDGTVADSMPLHCVAWRSTLAEWNCDFPEDLFYEWGGFRVTCTPCHEDQLLMQSKRS
jgi:beta-phosphoglucomutase-like phosphatase (HAD superfamily)